MTIPDHLRPLEELPVGHSRERLAVLFQGTTSFDQIEADPAAAFAHVAAQLRPGTLVELQSEAALFDVLLAVETVDPIARQFSYRVLRRYEAERVPPADLKRGRKAVEWLGSQAKWGVIMRGEREIVLADRFVTERAAAAFLVDASEEDADEPGNRKRAKAA